MKPATARGARVGRRRSPTCGHKAVAASVAGFSFRIADKHKTLIHIRYRSPQRLLYPPPAASAWSFDNNDFTVANGQAGLAGQFLDAAVGVQHGVAAGLAVGSAVQPVGREAAALTLQRHPRFVPEDADRADEAVAATVPPLARRPLAQFVALDTQRISDFERLDRRVHRVRHIALDAVVARPHRPPALAAADRLVIAVGPPARRRRVA